VATVPSREEGDSDNNMEPLEPYELSERPPCVSSWTENTKVDRKRMARLSSVRELRPFNEVVILNGVTITVRLSTPRIHPYRWGRGGLYRETFSPS
jgi:hypothetical protein